MTSCNSKRFYLSETETITWRLQVLKDAASLFANLIQKNNGIGIVRFDENAYPPNDPTYGGLPITKVLNDTFADAARITMTGGSVQLLTGVKAAR